MYRDWVEEGSFDQLLVPNSGHYCSEWVKKGIIGTNAKHAGKMASLNSLP